MLGEDQAQSPSPDEVRIREVRKHVAHGPFARRFWSRHDLVRRGGDDLFEGRRCAAKDGVGILVAEETEDRRDVGLRVIERGAGWVCEY